MMTRIIVADDHQIMRQGLRQLIERESDMEVVAEASNGREAVKMCRDLCPDVVVMDVGMPDMNGIEATRQILSQMRGVKILALSTHADRQYAAGMLGVGATGYVVKKAAFDELARAIRSIVAGQAYLSPEVASAVIQDYAQRVSDSEPSAFSVLTDREREVLQLVAEGRTTKQIASELHVSVKTVEKHRQHTMEKLDLHSVAELTKYAIQEGLTSPTPR